MGMQHFQNLQLCLSGAPDEWDARYQNDLASMWHIVSPHIIAPDPNRQSNGACQASDVTAAELQVEQVQGFSPEYLSDALASANAAAMRSQRRQNW